VFYHYACVDADLLVRNLGGDKTLARDSLHALIESAATVAPCGKQSSYASRARASYILVERGPQQPRSLAAAFLKAIDGDDILAASIAYLTRFRTNLDSTYGPCAEAAAEMIATAEEAKGSVNDILAFASDAVA
jgi:CRISPR system Cascade subunit CasC